MHIPLELSRLESKLRLPPVKAGGWGVETPLIMLGHPDSGGRVACAHVQPATVKAHAPMMSRFPTSGFGRRPERT